MKADRSVALVLALVVFAICCVVSCEEECPPCTPQEPPPDPGNNGLIGLWIVFEAFMDGVPFPQGEGMEWDFRDNDTLIAMDDTLRWTANDTQIVLTDASGVGEWIFDYYFEADTLDMSSEIMSSEMRLRLLREEDYPGS